MFRASEEELSEGAKTSAASGQAIKIDNETLSRQSSKHFQTNNNTFPVKIHVAADHRHTCAPADAGARGDIAAAADIFHDCFDFQSNQLR